MRSIKQKLSSAAIAAVLVSSLAGYAHANSIADVVDPSPVKDAAVTGQKAVGSVNTVSGMKTIYSKESYTLGTLGARDVSEHASTIRDYSGH